MTSNDEPGPVECTGGMARRVVEVVGTPHRLQFYGLNGDGS